MPRCTSWRASFTRKPGKTRDGQGELPLSTFTWNKTFIESCQADNLRQLDLDEYFGLKSPVSKRLYRFLGKRFYRQDDWTFDLHEIAFERVGLSRSYADAGKIKEKLQPAIDELEAIGFLRPLSRDDRYTRIDRGQWTIRLTRQSPALAAPQPSAPAAAEPEPPLVAELVSRGVTRATAAELVRQHPAERIQAKIDVFDWLTEKQDKRIAKSPAGYLVKSIADDYAAPKGFSLESRARAPRGSAASPGTRGGRAAPPRSGAGGPRPGPATGRRRLSRAPDPGRAEGAGGRGLAQADAEARESYENAPPRLRVSVLLGLVREHVAQGLLRGAISVGH